MNPVIAVAVFAAVLAVGAWVWLRSTEHQLETDLTHYLLTLPVDEWDL